MAIVNETQALKKLYKSVVGSETKKNEPSKIISELADNWSGGGGYDAEVKLYFGPGSSDPMVGAIIKGDYATLRSMIDEKMAPNVLARLWNDGTYYAAASDAVYVYSVNEEDIEFKVYLPKDSESSAGYFYTFVWDSSDVLATA